MLARQEAKAYLDTPINAAISVFGVFSVVAPVGAACLRDFFCKVEGMKDRFSWPKPLIPSR